MSRRFNFRVLLWSLAFLAAVWAGTYFLHAHQLHRTGHDLLLQADTALETKDFGKAASCFHLYLAFEPQDTAARVKYLAALENLPPSDPTRSRMVDVIEQVLRSEPDRQDLRLRQFQLQKTLGRYHDAIQSLEALLAANPQQPRLEHELGWCLDAIQDHAGAVEALTRAITKAPHQIESYILLAKLFQIRLDQADEVTRVMDEMVAANPESGKALLLRSQFHQQRGRLELAHRDILQAHKLTPQDGSIALAAAQISRLRGQLDEARSFLAVALELDPKSAELYRTLAAVELQAGRREKAIAALQRGLDRAADSTGIAFVLCELLIEDGRAEEYEPLLARMQADQKQAAWTDYLNARVLMQSDHWEDALAKLLALQANPPPLRNVFMPVDFRLGQCYEQFGETDRQLLAYRRAVQAQPDLLAARQGLISAALSLGLYEEAYQHALRLSEMPEPPQGTWTALARASLQLNLRRPERERSWGEVEIALKRALAATPESPWIPIVRAQMLAARGHLQQALQLLEIARVQQPREVLVWTSAAELMARSGMTDDAELLLSRARKQLGDSLELRLAAIQVALTRDPADARQKLESLAKAPLQPLTPMACNRFQSELAEAFFQFNDFPRAERLWRELAARQPRDLRSRFGLAEVALHNGQAVQARKLLADLRKLEGEEGILWRGGLATLLIQNARLGDQSELAQARKLLAEAEQRNPGWSRIPLMEAMLAELEGNLDRAVNRYLRAVELGEVRPALVQRAASLLADRKRFLEADGLLRSLEDRQPLSPELAKLAAEIALGSQNHPRAMRLARLAVSPNSRDYRDYLWLADTQRAADRPAEAEATLRQGLKVAPANPDVWVALVRHLTRTGQRTAAQNLLAQAKVTLPADRLPWTLARCYEVLGQLDEAERSFRLALAQEPNDFLLQWAAAEFFSRLDDFVQAEPLLRRLIAPATSAPVNVVTQARRKLAVGLAASGTSGAFQEAQALLDQNKKASGTTVADERARAIVLGNRPTLHAEALRRFEETFPSQPLAPEEQYWLVQLYDAQGMQFHAADLLDRLVTDQPENPRWLAHQIRSLAQRGDVEEARRQLDRLDGIEPGSRRVRELRDVLAKLS